MSFAELQTIFRDSAYDSVLSDLWKRGRKCGVEGLRVVTPKQVSNAAAKVEARTVTVSDLLHYAYGDYTFFKTPGFGHLVVSKRNS